MKEGRQGAFEHPQQRYDKAREQRRSKLRNNGPQPTEDASPAAVTLDDFYAYMPMHNYIYTPSRELWPAASVNARIPPVPLCRRDGKPVLDEDGEQVIKPPALGWIRTSRSSR